MIRVSQRDRSIWKIEKSRGKDTTIMYKRIKPERIYMWNEERIVGTEHEWMEENQCASGVIRSTANPLGRIRQAGNSWYRINKERN
ncbi:hypothetical protein GJ744_008354 [Endocarpon pusillum]|uniref:Uncharacterized protein n=1 Tax=Endocarpon pusillum TaxID=364733 RepID=A0A8H7E4J6_9EURO|nr:hypothetical protein GJ744_008354 [Endocarpon pusillum]